MVMASSLDNLLVIQARTSSRRLPAKVLKVVNGKPILEWQLLRVMKTKGVDQIIIATSEQTSDDVIEEIAGRWGIFTVRGSLDNVFSRFLKSIDHFNPTTVIRITGDCPFFMPRLCEQMLEVFRNETVDYLSNTIRPTYPDGCDIEIVSSNALRKLSKFNMTQMETEHVTMGIYTREEQFTRRNYLNERDDSRHRWTLDTAEDLEFVRAVYKHFEGRELTFSYVDVMSYLEKNPEMARYDNGSMRNSGLRHVD